MNVTPVVERELRAAARQPFTYLLRVITLAAILAACVLFGVQHGFGPSLGGRLFAQLHLTLWVAIWILVPWLTADSISRERREGTLGLLFLTGLTGSDVVTAKCVAHGMRALSLWLAVLPALTVPFVLGGVSWQEAALSALINLSSICWALAAGLLSSAWSKVRVRALIGAAICQLLFLLGLSGVTGLCAFGVLGPLAPTGWRMGPEFSILAGLSLLASPGTAGIWASFARLASPVSILLTAGLVTLISFLGLVLVIRLAGTRTRNTWRDEPPSARQLWWQRTFCTPLIMVSFFHRWMRRRLEQNPIGWLEQRTWSGRLVTWGWFAVVLSLYSAATTDRAFQSVYAALQRMMGWLLAGSLALSASGSFRRERETGVLEILLVSPLAESDIMWGRLRGLWGQFLPAFALFFGVWAYFASLFPQGPTPGLGFCCISFLTLPAIGLYFSLLSRTAIGAFLRTVVVGIIIPILLPAFLWLGWFAFAQLDFATWRLEPRAGACFAQICIALLCWDRLHARLKRRDFAAERA